MAEAFFALRAKTELIMLFWPIFGNFWCPVVTSVTFSSNLRNLERNPKKEDAIRPALSSPARFRNTKISKNVKKPLYLKKTFLKKRKFFAEKKYYPLSFPILGGRDSTRALQSSPFQISGRGFRERDGGRRTNEQTKEILVSNLGYL